MFAFRRFLLRRQVVVNLDDGSAVQGYLTAKAGPLLVLKSARLIEPGAEPLPIDGDVIVERRRVTFINAV